MSAFWWGMAGAGALLVALRILAAFVNYRNNKINATVLKEHGWELTADGKISPPPDMVFGEKLRTAQAIKDDPRWRR